MELLQIGEECWVDEIGPVEGIRWHYCSADYIDTLLETLYQEKLDSLPPLEEGQEMPTIRISFAAILLTSDVKESVMEQLSKTVEAYAVFYDESVKIVSESPTGFYRRKRPQLLKSNGTIVDKLELIHQITFSGQYGAKLKIPDIDVSPQFTGEVSYDGHVHAKFTGDFGEDFSPLYTYRFNLSSFSIGIELWQEYIKTGDCEIQMEITPIRKGSIFDVMPSTILSESDMADLYVLKPNESVGFYAISILAKGSGELQFGALHWRYSRQGHGSLVLGGQRYADAKRQEFISYFNPGDMKPPLNVYFSGFRGAEGFEGFGIMKSLKSPFMLIGDPRLEGGCFYLGSAELEAQVQQHIQNALDYLGFKSSELILSGLSMGSFGALYNASHFNPYGVVVGKPFTNLGDTARGMKLKRPDEFETIGDMLINTTDGFDFENIESLNQKFWDKFKGSSFKTTKFALAFMENDDYDNEATAKLIDYFSTMDAHIYAKGYLGRHNDNSRSINKWFMREYVNMLEKGFGRKF